MNTGFQVLTALEQILRSLMKQGKLRVAGACHSRHCKARIGTQKKDKKYEYLQVRPSQANGPRQRLQITTTTQGVETHHGEAARISTAWAAGPKHNGHTYAATKRRRLSLCCRGCTRTQAHSHFIAANSHTPRRFRRPPLQDPSSRGCRIGVAGPGGECSSRGGPQVSNAAPLLAFAGGRHNESLPFCDQASPVPRFSLASVGDSKQSRVRMAHSPSQDTCGRCGRTGHREKQCFARTHKNGSQLTSPPPVAAPSKGGKGAGKKCLDVHKELPPLKRTFLQRHQGVRKSCATSWVEP